MLTLAVFLCGHYDKMEKVQTSKLEFKGFRWSCPIYYSNLSKIMRDFIVDNKEIWQGKQVYLIATMGLFSGDGTGVAARELKKYGVVVTGGLHLKMPVCLGRDYILLIIQ